MVSCRVNFCREMLGVPFAIASIEIRNARDLHRAKRAAELKFARRLGVPHWGVRADRVDLDCAEPNGSSRRS